MKTPKIAGFIQLLVGLLIMLPASALLLLRGANEIFFAPMYSFVDHLEIIDLGIAALIISLSYLISSLQSASKAIKILIFSVRKNINKSTRLFIAKAKKCLSRPFSLLVGCKKYIYTYGLSSAITVFVGCEAFKFLIDNISFLIDSIN
jgi:hypothetical protein